MSDHLRPCKKCGIKYHWCTGCYATIRQDYMLADFTEADKEEAEKTIEARSSGYCTEDCYDAKNESH